MSDNLSPEDRHRAMRAVKNKQTGPERRLRSLLAGMGLRDWQLNYSGVLGKPDIAFPDQRVAIFVDGCFWHGCPVCNRPMPKANQGYWLRKINSNVIRDRRYNDELEKIGWCVIRIWEHELKRGCDFAQVRDRITLALKVAEPKQTGGVRGSGK